MGVLIFLTVWSVVGSSLIGFLIARFSNIEYDDRSGDFWWVMVVGTVIWPIALIGAIAYVPASYFFKLGKKSGRNG